MNSHTLIPDGPARHHKGQATSCQPGASPPAGPQRLEVNREAPSPSSPLTYPVLPAAGPRRCTVSGSLRRARAGWVRAVYIVTGFALLRWLGLGLAALFGYRHGVTVSLERAALDLKGERRLLGVPLGPSRRVLPLTAVRRAALVAESSGWALLAGATLVLVCATMAGVLLVWGIRGRQPSWMGLAALVLGAGLLLDALGYVWVRHRTRQARTTLEIHVGRERLRIGGASERSAHEFLSQVAATITITPQPRPRGEHAEQT